MKKVRKDTKGRPLHKGEVYIRSKNLYCFAYTDSVKKRHYIYDADLLHLRAKEKQVERDRLDGIGYYINGREDLNYAYERYLKTKTNLRNKTITNIVYAYEKHVQQGFGKRKLTSIRYSDIYLFYEDLIQSGLSLSSLGNINGIISGIFDMAVKDNVIRSNPTSGVMRKLKKKYGYSEKRHALTLEQERIFLNAVNSPKYSRWRTLMIFLFGTGCRISEALGIRWVDLDFEKNTISINHGASYGPVASKGFKTLYEINPTKTEAGTRMIPMIKEVREALLEEKKRQDEEGIHSVVEIGQYSGFVFFNRYGGLLKTDAVNYAIGNIVNEYNCEEDLNAVREGREPVYLPNFSCHVIRHTFCSRLCENETNLKVIQTVMGHTDIKVTMDIYAEVNEKYVQDHIGQINSKNIL